MYKRVLVSAPLDFLPDLRKEISTALNATFDYAYSVSALEAVPKRGEIEAWIVNPSPTYYIDARVLSLLPSLSFIATPSTGTSHIDLKECELRDIKVFCLRDTDVVQNITASSEYTFALMLSLIRNIPQACEVVNEGGWRDREDELRGREFSELTLGIIGLGRIGGNVARYSQSMGMTVKGLDPYLDEPPNGVTLCGDIGELCIGIDVLISAVHLNNTTEGMINKKVFDQLKNGSFYINTSRGGVVVEDDLIDAIEEGKLKRAAVDVVVGENSENISDNKLIKFAKSSPNLLVTPHIAGLTYDSERKAQRAAFLAVLESTK